VLVVLKFDLRSRCLGNISHLTLLNSHTTGTTTFVTRNPSNAWSSQMFAPWAFGVVARSGCEESCRSRGACHLI
jgi:hypothetical protein